MTNLGIFTKFLLENTNGSRATDIVSHENVCLHPDILPRDKFRLFRRICQDFLRCCHSILNLNHKTQDTWVRNPKLPETKILIPPNQSSLAQQGQNFEAQKCIPARSSVISAELFTHCTKSTQTEVAISLQANGIQNRAELSSLQIQWTQGIAAGAEEEPSPHAHWRSVAQLQGLQFGRQETPGCRKTLNPTPPSFHISATQTKSKTKTKSAKPPHHSLSINKRPDSKPKPNQKNTLAIHHSPSI